MKNRKKLLWILLIVLTGSIQMNVNANEQEEAHVIPVVTEVIMRTELASASLPVVLQEGSAITEIETNSDNFLAEYQDGAIWLTAYNITNYPCGSDTIINLTISGFDKTLAAFTESVSVTVQLENEQSLEESIDNKKNIDITFMDAYDRTRFLNALDEEIIAANHTDYSDKTAACVGDSITEGVGLLESQMSIYSYPAVLGRILDVKHIENLGEGGTSISSYWDSFFSATEGIANETNVIIVLGGVNDCYSGNEENLGNLSECTPRTFYGDTDFLMKDLKERYPESYVVFVTPLSTITNTTYLSFLPNMLPLSDYADAIKELGEKNNVDVFDLYGERFLDSHDETIVEQFMYDGVHPNIYGYQMLAEHIAAKLIENDGEWADED